MKENIVWGVELEYPTEKPIVPMNVCGHLFMVANAEIYGAEDAEIVRASAEEFAAQMQKLLIDFSELGLPAVDILLEKYVSRL